MSGIQRLGVLTSGGDCAGLNAVIRAVVHRAVLGYGWDVFGIMDGTLGLTERPMRYRQLRPEDVPGGTMLRAGGTMLGTINKGDPFSFTDAEGRVHDRAQEFVEGYKELGLDALVVIGGDGSMAILRKLARRGHLRMVGIPKTIDNDVIGTEYAVGFATAVNAVVDALDRLQPTAASHHRVMVLEVMGRDSGHIALESGIAGGADAILIPEIPYTLEGLYQQLARVMREGQRHALVVVAEGVKTETGGKAMVEYAGNEKRYGGIGEYISHRLTQRAEQDADTSLEARVTVLGHVQRGGVPSWRDRLIASAFGAHAVDLVAQGRFDRMVAWNDRNVTDINLADVVTGSRPVDPHGALVLTARAMGAYVGEPE